MSSQRVKAETSTKRISESYYIRSVSGEYNIPQMQVWQIGDGVANRIDVTGPMNRFEAEPGETICVALRRAGFEPDGFHEADLGPGEFYPRM
jgi:hypothetical protein